jgi:mRNA-degrading endonuclease YafQ of YafQ-DinJ toxin-antitoxin module
MIELIWDEKFKRLFKKWNQKHPELKEQFRDKEKKKILLIDLGTHKEVY